jgi:hypothetical protein
MTLPLDHSVLDADCIRERGKALGLDLPHPEQMTFLQNLQTIDVQAAPGCGKTTLAGLKLCLLGSGWLSDRQGICVLSHTNAAKNLIRGILERDRYGGRLLAYPHHVGTIQSFVDTFLALPYLRSKNTDVRSVDDDYYEQVALRALANVNSYSTLRSYFQRRQNGDALVAKSILRFHDGQLRVQSEAGSLPFGPTTECGKELRKLKQAMCKAGVFRFSDMFALAARLMHDHPELLDALRWRFPFCLIDEMQDTSALQEAVLGAVFSDVHCVMQRIGDVNQRIYSEGKVADDIVGERVFPCSGALHLPKSLRFAQPIASVVSKLTTGVPQAIVGSTTAPVLEPTLLVFDVESVSKVLGAFASEVSHRVSGDVLATREVKAIGARKASTANAFPQALRTYHAAYLPLTTSHASRPRSLYSAAIRAQQSADIATTAASASDVLWGSVCEILNVWQFRIGDQYVTSRRLRRFLDEKGASSIMFLRRAMLEILLCDLQSELPWTKAAQGLIDVIQRVCSPGDPPKAVADYIAFGVLEPQAVVTDPVVSGAPTFHCDECEITVGLDTIHNSKGETHAATLVLECCDNRGRGHDLAEVLPVLVGKGDPKRMVSQTVASSLRTAFVGMTRPRALLCLAVLKDHASAYLDDLAKAGWRIVDLTGGSTEGDPPPAREADRA